MQTDPAQLQGIIAYLTSLGPTGLLAGYLVYKDLYKPWQTKRTDKANGNGHSLNGTAYVRETDFSGLSQSLRDFKEQHRIDMDDIKERLLTLERSER